VRQYVSLAQHQGIEADQQHAEKGHEDRGQRLPADLFAEQQHGQQNGHGNVGLLHDGDRRDVSGDRQSPEQQGEVNAAHGQADADQPRPLPRRRQAQKRRHDQQDQPETQ
jgi:hypothetical protein